MFLCVCIDKYKMTAATTETKRKKRENPKRLTPCLQIEGYDGPARIEVSLVTDENPPRIHAHKLVGKNCENGVCKLEINSTASSIRWV